MGSKVDDKPFGPARTRITQVHLAGCCCRCRRRRDLVSRGVAAAGVKKKKKPIRCCRIPARHRPPAGRYFRIINRTYLSVHTSATLLPVASRHLRLSLAFRRRKTHRKRDLRLTMRTRHEMFLCPKSVEKSSPDAYCCSPRQRSRDVFDKFERVAGELEVPSIPFPRFFDVGTKNNTEHSTFFQTKIRFTRWPSEGLVSFS